MRPQLNVIVGSVREGRVGLSIANWFMQVAHAHGAFEPVLADLKTINLPMLDEPNHPRLGKYTHEHTKAWSALTAAADAFVFVSPEYNYGTPPAIVNALDYLYAEWQYKPAGFVTYGGMAGGARGIQMTKQIMTTLKIVPMVETVYVPFFNQHMKDGAFDGTDAHKSAAVTMLDELSKWSAALRGLRA